MTSDELRQQAKTSLGEFLDPIPDWKQEIAYQLAVLNEANAADIAADAASEPERQDWSADLLQAIQKVASRISEQTACAREMLDIVKGQHAPQLSYEDLFPSIREVTKCPAGVNIMDHLRHLMETHRSDRDKLAFHSDLKWKDMYDAVSAQADRLAQDLREAERRADAAEKERAIWNRRVDAAEKERAALNSTLRDATKCPPGAALMDHLRGMASTLETSVKAAQEWTKRARDAESDAKMVREKLRDLARKEMSIEYWSARALEAEALLRSMKGDPK